MKHRRQKRDWLVWVIIMLVLVALWIWYWMTHMV